MTEKELITNLKGLKNISPRKEWVALLKSQIVETKQAGILDIFSAMFYQRKLAYSFAVLLFVIVGAIGFAQYTMPGDLLFSIKKVSEQSEAALTGKTGVKQNAAILNNRIKDLALAAQQGKKQNIPSVLSEIRENAQTLAKDLKNNPTDSASLKEIAVSLKTLASVPGADLTENSDVKDLYQTVVENQIKDMEKLTLTDEQNKKLEEVKKLYEEGKYTVALEEMLLINN